MCLAIPARVLDVKESRKKGTAKARIEFDGVVVDVSLEFSPQTAIGDWVLVFGGYILNRVPESDARETLELIKREGLGSTPVVPRQVLSLVVDELGETRARTKVEDRFEDLATSVVPTVRVGDWVLAKCMCIYEVVSPE